MSKQEQKSSDKIKKNGAITSIHIDGMYEDWFLDYASYVILERAVPALLDGLKPVQRRILHSMKEMDDGRFHKVANIIGQSMQFHPHGDAAIGDALVNMGQKDLMIETQGNWGDTRTGDRAAAPRYIEARLTKFALETSFNSDLTEWQLSYDGRKNEPILLPVKFPLLLAHGTEGIAVGLATKVLPHNFCELCKASIDILKGKNSKILPDFPTAGMADFSDYNSGKRGGKIKVRARIEASDKKNLLIKEIPYGTTTTMLIDSILKANDKGKIKIKKVMDNTAKEVEIAIELPSGVSPDVTIDALYAFTNCEVSISPNATVIVDDRPVFYSVDEILEISTENTKDLLGKELQIRKNSLEEKWHFASLEKIFIEKRIYRKIEECETWEAVIKTIDKGLKPYVKKFKRAVTEEDIVRLTEIKIKRISKFDSFRADELIKKLEEDLKIVKHHLKHLTEYSIDYFKNLLEKYGNGKERKTEIRNFDTIQVAAVAAANQKLYVNRAEGFIGYGLKKDEFVTDCSDIDDIIVFRKDGKMMVSRIEDKKFVGKDILHVQVWKKGDDRTIYHLIYQDGASKKNYIKRFAVTSITRDKEYDLTKGSNNSKVVYFSVHPNSEEETITIHLHPSSRAKNKTYDFNFGELAIKGRGAQGNILTKYPIRKIDQQSIGASTLGGVDIWIDDSIGRLNKDERGVYLGNFDHGDQILVLYKDGTFELTNYELTNRYDMPQVHLLRKFNPEWIISVVYMDGKSKNHFVKRFQIDTKVTGKKYSFISEHPQSKLLVCSIHPDPEIKFTTLKGKDKIKEIEQIKIKEFIDTKGWKALGNRLSPYKISGKIILEESEIPEAEEQENENDEIVAEKKPQNKSNSKKVQSKKSTKKLDVGSLVEFDIKKGTSKTKSKRTKKKSDKQGDLFN